MGQPIAGRMDSPGWLVYHILLGSVERVWVVLKDKADKNK